MIMNIIAKASFYAFIFLLFSGEAKFSGKEHCSAQETEWRGYFDDIEATLRGKKPTDYYEDVAKAALIFAGTAYEVNRTKIQECLPEFTINTYLTTNIREKIDGYTIPVIFRIGGFVGNYKGKYIVAAFQGTSTLLQMGFELADFAALESVLWDEKYVVDYWDKVAKDMMKNVTETLRKLLAEHSAAPVIVTGHSLGGATATAVLARLFANNFNLPMDRLFIYTYGQPRVGGWNFANWYNSKVEYHHFRVVHYKDVAVHGPCCRVLDGQCSHAGEGFRPWHVQTEI